MMKSLTTVLGLTLLLQLNPKLDSFKHEAETALRGRIEIVESEDIGISNGQTYCDRSPIRIVIRAGLAPDLKEQVLAHEIGHALLCSRGIVIFSYSSDAAKAEGVEGISAALGSAIASCFIDPLADAEASKRGLKTEMTTEALLQKARSHTKEEIHQGVSRFGELSSSLPAIAIYCSDLLPHSFPISDMERVFAGEPSVISRLQELRRVLGKPKCRDAPSCFILAKKLRDEFELRRFVLLRNPKTGTLE